MAVSNTSFVAVNRAVHFLRHPRVKAAPLDAKLQFLRWKGLNDEQVVEAFSRAHPELAALAARFVRGELSALRKRDELLQAEETTTMTTTTWKVTAAWMTGLVFASLSAFQLSSWWSRAKRAKEQSDSARHRCRPLTHGDHLSMLCAKSEQPSDSGSHGIVEDLNLIHDKLKELAEALEENTRQIQQVLSAILASVNHRSGSPEQLPSSDSSADVVSQQAAVLAESMVLVEASESAGTVASASGLSALQAAFQELCCQPDYLKMPAADAILMVLREMMAHPENIDYRRILRSDQVFREQIANVPAAKALLEAIGYVREDDYLEWKPSLEFLVVENDIYWRLVTKARQMLENLRAGISTESHADNASGSSPDSTASSWRPVANLGK